MTTIPTPLRSVVIAPDKFKGSLSAADVADAVATGIRDSQPDATVIELPLADGGDGSVVAALAAGFTPVEIDTVDPTGEPLTTTAAVRDGVAIIEVARICGFGQLPRGELRPLSAGTAGVGFAIAGALSLHEPLHTIALALGGSVTTDGGIGMLRALGARAHGRNGGVAAHGGGWLTDIAAVDLDAMLRLPEDVRLIGLADVENPLLGPRGAAHVFGPQKGATPQQVLDLDRGLAHLVTILDSADLDATGLAAAAGSGAAGGLGFAVRLLGGSLTSGAQWFLDLLGAEDLIAGADLVITGEGSLDEQTLAGKLPGMVARTASRHGVPCIAVVGRCTLSPAQLAAADFATVSTLAEVAEGRRTDIDASFSRGLLVEIGQHIGKA